MAGEIQIDSVTALTASGSNIVLNNVDTATNRTNLGLGSMATQNANAVAITGGSVSGVTLGGDVAMASSGKTVRNITQVALSADQTLDNSTTLTTFFSPTYTPLFSGSQVQGVLTMMLQTRNNITPSGGAEGRKICVIEFTGSDITDITLNNDETENIGGYSFDDSGIAIMSHASLCGPLLSTTGTSTITANCKLKNKIAGSVVSWTVLANNTFQETFMTWIEYK